MFVRVAGYCVDNCVGRVHGVVLIEHSNPGAAGGSDAALVRREVAGENLEK